MKTKLILFFLFLSINTWAQQDAQFSQYMLNTVVINPAYAGSRGIPSFFGLHRSQWIGFDGAPTTNALSGNLPIAYSQFGVGASLMNDKIGPINTNSISADLSYTIDVSQDYKLAFGLNASLNLFSLNANKLNASEIDDPKLQSIKGNIAPNFGTGLYLHSDQYYFGFSIHNMIQNMRTKNLNIYKEKTNYYLITGYVFDLNYDFQFKPALMVKLVAGAPIQADVSSNILIKEKITFGLSYRWSAAISAMAGYQINNFLYLGYGYDFDTTELSNYNAGSHELFLRFELFKDNSRISTPRFF